MRNVGGQRNCWFSSFIIIAWRGGSVCVELFEELDLEVGRSAGRRQKEKEFFKGNLTGVFLKAQKILFSVRGALTTNT